MKSIWIQLRDDDQKGRNWIRENLEWCAYSRTLSRKLLDRFSTKAGSMIALVPDWVDLDQLELYSQGSIRPEDERYAKGDSPEDQLVAFVKEYLKMSANALVVCENSGDARKTLEIWNWSRRPRFAEYGNDEVYYILVASDSDAEMIDATLSDTLGQWGTAVCSSSERIPEGEIPDASFLEEITANTLHVLMPAFDNDGYLIWSPVESSHS